MTRKSLALLPVYMLAMLLTAIIGLTGSIILFIPMMIRPNIVTPVRDEIMNRFMNLFAEIAAKRLVQSIPTEAPK